jgi:NADPH-dependent 2,4-dienoyl-CoA reductase/sulfur reductase-like enzyme/nitrite reductase/ring-hydroxylating ferredoxin subunit
MPTATPSVLPSAAPEPMTRVARVADLADQSITKATIDGTDIVLARDGETIGAFAATCPHAGAPLEQGAVCNHRLICPWHKSVFDLRDGAIIEPPALERLARYPVRIENGDVLVSARPIDDEADLGPLDGKRVLILGSGAAGTAAAFALREAGFAGAITMIGEEANEPYDRTALSKFVLNDMSPAEVPALRRDGDWKRLRIDRIDSTITQLDIESRRVVLGHGETIDYDSAVLASGASPNVPTMPGVHLRGVHPLRNRFDAAAIVASAPPGARAVVVGSSFIGLESASALRERGVGVTVVAPEEIPFERQFGREIGAMFRRLHEANGVVFRAGRKLERIEGDEKVAAVVLEGGERIAADLVVLGLGVKPATGFVSGARKADDGGIIVDSTLCAAGGLYVAGDVACFPYEGEQIRIEHWRVAQQQGRVAAANIAGVATQIEIVPYFWTYHYGKQFEYLGHAMKWDRLHIDGDLDQHHFVALQIRGDHVVGVIACERERETAVMIETMRKPLTLADALSLLR